jgi:DNA-binding beta-propeller fold protein YncE
VYLGSGSPCSASSSCCFNPNNFAAGRVGALAPAHAQTAHSGATVSVGGGFISPHGVAVDGSGNVFVADGAHLSAKSDERLTTNLINR